jgi:hypothetical protein
MLIIFKTDASYRSRYYSYPQAKSSAAQLREAMKMRLQPLILMFTGVPIIPWYVSIMLNLDMTQVELQVTIGATSRELIGADSGKPLVTGCQQLLGA